MSRVIKLNELQLKQIISDILLEERKKFFPPLYEMMPNHKEIIQNAFDTFETDNPKELHPKLKKYKDEIQKLDSSPDLELAITYLISLLEEYYGLGEIVRPDRTNRSPNKNSELLTKGVTYIQDNPNKRKFEDRYKFKRGDLS